MNDMKLFRFCLWDYDGDSTWLLMHTQAKTEAQFQNDVNSLLRKYGGEYMDKQQKEGHWVDSSGWTVLAMEHMQELGYSSAEVTNYSLKNEGIINLNSPAEQWKKTVGTRLFNRANQMNKALENRMFEEDEKDETP